MTNINNTQNKSNQNNRAQNRSNQNSNARNKSNQNNRAVKPTGNKVNNQAKQTDKMTPKCVISDKDLKKAKSSKFLFNCIRAMYKVLEFVFIGLLAYGLIMFVAMSVIPILSMSILSGVGLGIDSAIVDVIVFYGMPMLFIMAMLFVGSLALLRWIYRRVQKTYIKYIVRLETKMIGDK